MWLSQESPNTARQRIAPLDKTSSAQEFKLHGQLKAEITRLAHEREALLAEAVYSEQDPLIRQLTASIEGLRDQLPAAY